MAVSSACKDGKYARYTVEQVEALERHYHECPKPSSLRRQQLIRECPILSNIEPKQIKVWFQNRRCREKQRKEASRLQAVNRKLTAMNKLLLEENDRLQKQVAQLVYENGNFRQQTQNVAAEATTDTSSESVVTSGQPPPTSHCPPKDASPAGLVSIAEETLTEFLSKATGTAVEWIQLAGMKPGPDSIGIIAIAHGCTGVAARACGLVSLEPTRVAEILKDRPSWYRDCRTVDVMNVMSTANGGTIELIYMQLYALTTLALGRDFWFMRYTTMLEDGSIVVCERSLNNTQNGPSMPEFQHFVRAEVLPSGYLIRPCEGGGSIIHIVDHMDLEPWRVPEVLCPIYESSTLLAQKMTMAAVRQLRQISHEVSQMPVSGWGRRPAALRALSQRLSRGFNEAISGVTDEGWCMMENDGVDYVTILVNSTPGKMDVSPAVILRFLREHRSEWADSRIDAYAAAAAAKSVPGTLHSSLSKSVAGQVFLPLAHTNENEEADFLEVVRHENVDYYREDIAMPPADVFLLQLCSGFNEKAVGAPAEFIFAPIDTSFSDNAPLLPSGFRIIPIESTRDVSSPKCTLDLTSALEGCPAGTKVLRDQSSYGGMSNKSIMTIAFQFAIDAHLQENVACVVRQYIPNIISFVQRVASALSPRVGSLADLQLSVGSGEAQTLARNVCQSYRCCFGTELLKPSNEGGESTLKGCHLVLLIQGRSLTRKQWCGRCPMMPMLNACVSCS